MSFRLPTAALQPPRSAFTLIEMLVAMACTLVMMGAVVSLFGVIGDSVTNSRATIEMSERLRGARNRLQLDLAGATATTLPPLRPEVEGGMIEIQEGPNTDWNKTWVVSSDTSFALGMPGYDLTGDADDVLMLTVHSRGQPFLGRFTNAATGAGTTIESEVAEVIWYAVEQPLTIPGIGPKLYTLYRRVLLVSPQTAPNIQPNDFQLSTRDFQQLYDISARWESSLNQIVLNSLGDLSKRECRWWHFPHPSNTIPFPYPTPYPFYGLDTNYTPAKPIAPLDSRNISGHTPSPLDRTAEDVVLTNVLAFNIQVYDPTAPLMQDTSTPPNLLVPSDPGYTSGSTAGVVGAFVDLNYAKTAGTSFFSGPGQAKSQLLAGSGVAYATYDTWSLHTENNGVDEDSTNGPDTGFDGVDSNSDGVVDDPAELDTWPPYSVPLRGIQIKIRVYESDSRQIREVTVVQDFLPE